MLDVVLAVVGLLAVVVAAVSERMRRLPLSVPLIAVVVGALAGPHALGVVDVGTVVDRHAEFHEGARVLLAISVMAIALRYPFRDARAQLRPVVLLLLVAMPTMAAITAGLSALTLGLGLGAALLVGTALSPTDPVLASSTVTGGPAEETLPDRTRQLLSLESGANDGLALPLVIAAVAVAGPMSAGSAVLESAWQVLGAALVGLVLGWVAGRALRIGEEHGAVEPGPALLFTLVLALGTLGISGLIRVDGILAVFVAGLAFNRVSTTRERDLEVPIDEAVNNFVVLPLFLLLGAALPWGAWGELGWGGVLLAVLVLLLRRLPVLVALRPLLRLRWRDAVYLGWFGPVGVSALFYLTLEASRLGVGAAPVAAGALVVAVSTLAHGFSSAFGLKAYEKAEGKEGPLDAERPQSDSSPDADVGAGGS